MEEKRVGRVRFGRGQRRALIASVPWSPNSISVSRRAILFQGGKKALPLSTKNQLGGGGECPLTVYVHEGLTGVMQVF